MNYRARIWTAGIAVGALLLGACGSDTPAASEFAGGSFTAQPVAAGLSDGGPSGTEPLEWDDDYNHFVVLTSPDGAVPETPVSELPPVELPTQDELDALADPVEPAAPVADIGSNPTGSILVRYLDGYTITVNIGPGELYGVAARNAAEQRLLDRPDTVLIVADVSGILGTPNVHYLWTFEALEELPQILDPDESADSSSTEAAAMAPPGDSTLIESAAGANDAAIADALRDVPGVVEVTLTGPGIIEVTTEGDAASLMTVAGVAEVHENFLAQLFTDDPRQHEQWMLTNTGSGTQAGGWPGVAGVDTGAPAAWNVGRGANIVVAVVDSGVQTNHPDFAGRMWSNPGEICGNGADNDGNGFVDDCAGWDFGDNDANPNPNQGVEGWLHGTHVAGLVAAGQNGVGVVGIAPQATIMPIKVSNSAGTLSGAAVAAAINYAVANDADIINLSLGFAAGTPRSSMTWLEDTIVNARNNGVLVVAATGNSNLNLNGTTSFPSSYADFYDNVIAVGASTNADERASFSNYNGPTNIYAPGWWTLSTLPDSTWGMMSGTSMATPVVAGAAAVLMSTGQATTPSAVRTRLVSTSVSRPFGPRLDLAAAVGATVDSGVTVNYTGIDALRSDTNGQIGLNVRTADLAAASQLRISMAAKQNGQIYAVDGLQITATGVGTLTTSTNGALPTIPVSPQALTAGGANLNLSMALPTGEFALVTELLDSNGGVVGGAQVAYMSISETGSTVTTTTAPANPIPTTTIAGGGGGDGDGDGDGGAGDGDGATTTVAGGGGGDGEGGGTPTTQVGDDTATTTPGGSTVIVTTTIANNPSPTTTTVSGPGAGTTTTIASGGGGGGGGGGDGGDGGGGEVGIVTTTTAGDTTTTTAPPTTTPPPEPDSDGPWSVLDMDPRYSPAAGGVSLMITGVFPTNVPVYVWFGDERRVRVYPTDNQILLTSPSMTIGGVFDVVVRFRTLTNHELTLVDAFTYGDPVDAPTATTIPSGATTTTAPGAGGGGGDGGGGDGGGGEVPVTTTTSPGGGVTTTTISGGGATPTTTAPSQGGTIGSLTLRTPTSGTAVSRLQTSAWPANGCNTSTCTATNF